MNQYSPLRVDLSNFPNDERFAQIPGKLFLADNFDESSSESFQQGRSINRTVQVSMALFFICLTGELKFDINHKPVTAVAGQTVFVLPGSFFRYVSQTPGAKVAFMAIDHEFVDYSKDVKLGLELGEQLNRFPVLSVPPFEIEEFLSMYKIMKRKLYDPNYLFKEEVARAFLTTLECNIFNDFLHYKQSDREQRSVSRKDEIFRQFVSEVELHFKQERSVSFYADKLFVTPKYLSTVIHEVSGRYATDFITAFVINECKALLHSEHISIKEVCNEMNFPNQSFFAKYFKQHTGMTPKEYKQKL